MIAWLILALCAPASAALTLGQVSVVDRPFRLDSEELAIGVEHGVLVAVTDDGAPAGVVCVCSATAALTPGTERERTALAARLASPGFDDEGGGAALEVEGLVILGVDVAEALAPVAVPVTIDGSSFVRAGEGDVAEEVMVVEARAGRAQAQAQRLLRQVEDGLVATGMDPRELLALDRADPGGPPHRVTAVVAPGWRLDGRRQPGLTRIDDPTGVLGWQAARVVVPGLSWSGEPVARAGELERRVDLVGVGLTTRFEVVPHGMSVTVSSAAQLRVRAVGGPASTLVLEIPHAEAGFWRTMAPEVDGWGIDTIEAGGGPLDWHLVAEGDREYRDGWWRRVHVALPAPLAEGETLELTVTWTDRQRYAHLLEVPGSSGQSSFLLYGLASEVTELLPRAPSHGGAPVAVRFEVGVIGGIEQDEVLASARPSRTWTDEATEARWVSGKTTGGLAAVVGRFQDEEPLPTRPRVRLRRQRVGAPELEADTVAAALAYLDQVLPDPPLADLAVAQSWHEPEAPGADVSHGLIGFHLLRPVGGDAGDPPAWLLASGLAQQWWHGSAPTPDERTLSEAAGVAYGVWFAEAIGRKSGRYADELFLQPARELPARVGPRDPRVGGWLLARTWSARFGREVVQASLSDVLAGDGPADWPALERALAARTGEDLEGVSAPWVEGGLLPSVAVRWRLDGDRVSIEVESNVPRGRVDVPVQVARGRKQVTEVVVVRDGRGSTVVSWSGKPPESVTVDPEGELLLGRTRVQRDEGGP